MKDQNERLVEQIGFRVVSGRSKSGKIALLKTTAIAKMFGIPHDQVLQDVRQYLERRPMFAEHCRPSFYRAADGTDQPCFELTEVGFLTLTGA